MQIRKITTKLEDYQTIKSLKERAFPQNEQYPMWLLVTLSKRKCADFLAFYDEGLFCGFCYLINTPKMVFVLYLAINDKLRSKGYGSKILDSIKEMAKDKEIVLNVEAIDTRAENYEQRVKRKAFYERNGFKGTNYCLEEKTFLYEVLSTSYSFDIEEYKKLLRTFSFGFYTPNMQYMKE